MPFTVVGEPLPPKPWETPNKGPPTGAPPPAAAPPAAPRTTAPSAASATPTEGRHRPPRLRRPEPAPAVVVPAPGPAPGCADCERLAGGEALTAGDDVTLSYSGFQPGEQVTLVMRSTPVELGTFTADAAGVVTATVTLPASAEAGSHTLTFSGPVTGDHVVRFRLCRRREAAVNRGAAARRHAT